MTYLKPYDKEGLIKALLGYVLIAGLMRVTHGNGFVLVVPLVFMALLKGHGDKLFYWLLITVAMMAGNQILMPKSTVFALTQRGLMVTLGCVMMMKLAGGRQMFPVMKPFLLMIPYCLFMLFPSAFGWSPLVSYLKLFLFTVVYFAYLGAVKSVSDTSRLFASSLRNGMLAFSIFFVFGSMLLLPFPSIGQLSGEEYLEAIMNGRDVTSLFRGMTMQSQSLGPIVAGISVFLFSDLLFSIRKWDKLYVALLLCCPILIFKTSSRTGMGSYLIGMMYVGYEFMKARGISSRWRSRALSTCFMLLVLAVGALLVFGAGGRGISGFMLKGDAETRELSVENVFRTRQALMDRALENFHKSPMIGNGFQVSEEMEREKRDSIRSILTAPIEKGVWVSAVLEESGVVGMFLFLIWMGCCIFVVSSRRGYASSACIVLLLMTNLGEFTVFSTSYTGGVLWAITFASLAFDVQRLRLTKGPAL